MRKQLVLFCGLNMCNKLIIRHLSYKLILFVSRIRASLLLFLSLQNRVVLQLPCKALNLSKTLIISTLNSLYNFGFAIKSMYLCIAKDPYYGRFEDRYSTHGYANPVRDAAGSRGIIRAW
jgi:hypothetical protein